MNFQKWFKKNFKGLKFGMCIQDPALEVGWGSCKQEVLKILNKNIETVRFGYDKQVINKKVIEEIEKL